MLRPRNIMYTLIYGAVYYLSADLSWPQLLGAFAVATGVVLGVHFYLKKGDAEILKKVQTSQDRYEYEQEKKALAAKKAPKPKGTYRE